MRYDLIATRKVIPHPQTLDLVSLSPMLAWLILNCKTTTTEYIVGRYAYVNTQKDLVKVKHNVAPVSLGILPSAQGWYRSPNHEI